MTIDSVRYLLKKLLVIGGFFILLIFSIAFGFATGDYLYFRERILPNYYLEEYHLGGLREEEAIRYLGDKLALFPRSLTFKTQKFEYLPSDVGAVPLIEESVQRVFRFSHQENYFAGLWSRYRGESRSYPFYLRLVDEKKLFSFVLEVARKADSPPRNAKFIVDESNQVVLVAEQIGVTVDINGTAALLEESINRGSNESFLKVESTPPLITTQTLSVISRPTLLGSYTTYYGTHDSPNRIHNIHLLAKKITETIVGPDKFFSLLSKTGKFTEKEGYKEAFVIIRDELIPQYGGGACQIATTLYNAVQLVDLDILSRVNHNMYFSIYPLGRDATIYPPSPDLKFRNNTGESIIIYATATKKSLSFRIFGTYTGKEVLFSAPQLFYHKRVKAGPTPFSVIVERTVKKDGKVIRTETIKSFYIAHGDHDLIKVRRREPR